MDWWTKKVDIKIKQVLCKCHILSKLGMKDVLEYVLDNVKRFILLFCIKLASFLRVGLCLNTQLLHLCAASDYRVIGIARLYAEFGEYPDPVGEFERLIQHVLAFYVPLGDGVDIVVLQFA